MAWLVDIFILIITAYLSFTNTLALHIETLVDDLFIQPGNSLSTPHATSTTESLTQLPSAYESIPDILLKNSGYQQASLASSYSATSSTSSTKQALVNIFCTYSRGEENRAITGTGFFIDAKGVILTNAHVAQFLLLPTATADNTATCSIRTGSPATPTFSVDVLYIPPAWILENAHLLSNTKPEGTGERDYALLYVNGSLNQKPLPSHFPALSINTSLLTRGSLQASVTAGGYPAQNLFEQDAHTASLVPRTATTSITELMTFGSNFADVMSLAGSAIGAQGSSGGPVLDSEREVIGVISTRGDDSSFGAGSLRAITLSYVDRTIQEETGLTLQQNLQGDLPLRSRIFKESIAPYLRELLMRELAPN